MQSDELNGSLELLLGELVYGAPTGGAYVLNGGDPGLLQSLEELSATAASQSSSGGATVAAHTAHITYALSLMNRWAAGENPFGDADWSQAWRISAVREEEWAALRAGLASEAGQWHRAARSIGSVSGVELHGVIASVAHLAYHMGAIRQIAAAARGPRDSAATAESDTGG